MKTAQYGPGFFSRVFTLYLSAKCAICIDNLLFGCVRKVRIGRNFAGTIVQTFRRNVQYLGELLNKVFAGYVAAVML